MEAKETTFALETTFKVGKYKYIVEFGAPTKVRILKDGVRHEEMLFPTEQHFHCFLKGRLSVD